VASVLDGSPAMEAGLYADDEIVAVDGLKCDAAGLIARADERRPGEVLQVTLFRREKLLTVPVTLGARPLELAWLAKVEQPTDAQRAAYEAWLGAPWSAE
jgi:predicted metalloprotease with PDZ domain